MTSSTIWRCIAILKSNCRSLSVRTEFTPSSILAEPTMDCSDLLDDFLKLLQVLFGSLNRRATGSCVPENYGQSTRHWQLTIRIL